MPPTILMNGFDGDSNIQREFHAGDVKVEVDRKQVQVLSVSVDRQPRHIILMVDSSGSMAASSRKSGWGIALSAANYAVHVVPANASAALVTFSDRIERESSDFENRKQIAERIPALAKREPKHYTALFDSVEQVMSEFKELRPGDAIYIVTDGGDNRSRISLPQLEKELTSRHIRVFIFLVPQKDLRTSEELNALGQMDGFAESTGGDLIRLSAAELVGDEWGKIDKLVPRIVSQVAEVYFLELGISPLESPARVKVALSERGPKVSHDVTYSHFIVPCRQ